MGGLAGRAWIGNALRIRAPEGHYVKRSFHYKESYGRSQPCGDNDLAGR
jgi:hypothetical protein